MPHFVLLLTLYDLLILQVMSKARYSDLASLKSSTGYPQLPTQPLAASRDMYTSIASAKDPASSDSLMDIKAAGKGSATVSSRTKQIKYGLCIQPGCTKAASCNIRSQKQRIYCAAHKLIGMVDVSRPPCDLAGCSTRPCFNTAGASKGRFCKKHRQDGMVEVTSRKCEEPLCSKQSHYNTIGELRGVYCGKHKQPGMVDVTSRLCEQETCWKHPNFSTQGEKVGRFCAKHKQPGMIDVSSKLCEADSCNKQPSFGSAGGLRRFCITHRHSGMVCLTGVNRPQKLKDSN